MRSYEVKLPRGVEVDIFNLPEDFEEQIRCTKDKETGCAVLEIKSEEEEHENH